MAAGKTLSPHAGHRARLRERFRRGGLDGMLDYEVMELVLTMLIPMRDVKPLAKSLLLRFGSVAEVLDAAPEELAAMPGISEVTATNFKVLRSLVTLYLEQKCRQEDAAMIQPELAANFARSKLGASARESYMLIYLDAGQHMIDYEVVSEGTVDRAFFYVRNLVEAALRRHAVGVILIHNHPSGRCVPSPDDMSSTEKLFSAFVPVGIHLVDHLIVSRGGYFSFAANGILERFRKELEKEKRL